MQKEGYKAHTVRSAVSSLKSIARRTRLLDVEAVKGYLATAGISECRKEILALHLSRFYRYSRISFDRPRYKRIEKLPFIPLESEIDQLIGGVGKKTAAFLQLLKETGMRPGEAWNLKWIDIDFEKGTVNVAPEKNSKPRELKISSQTIAMLNQLPRKSSLIFHFAEADPVKSLDYFRRVFTRQRGKAVERLQNSRISLISFKTLRHFKATTEYHRTKDILHVMRLLGHRSIRNTLVYIQLVDFESDEYACKVAKTVEEAEALIEEGFDYVTEMEGLKLFKKRK
jgi:integrase